MPSDGAIHVISRTARDLEVPLPEPLLAQIGKARAFVAAAEDVDGSPTRLHEAVLDAIRGQPRLRHRQDDPSAPRRAHPRFARLRPGGRPAC